MTLQTTSQSPKSNLLRRSLLTDGLVSGISGVILIVGAKPLTSFLGLDIPLILVVIGVVLVLYAAMLLQAAIRTPPNRQTARAAVILNLVWVFGSAVILVTGWPPLTTWGKWMIAIVADVVAVFAVLQFYGIWRMSKR